MEAIITLHAGGPASIEEFADRHGLRLLINERNLRRTIHGASRFYAMFEDSYVMDCGLLCGSSGNGDSPQDAVVAYCENIRGTRIVILPNSSNSREIDVPNVLTVSSNYQEWLCNPKSTISPRSACRSQTS
jgi:hypothetical protein